MDTRGFLQSVVPWEEGAYVTIHWQRPGNKKFFGRSFQSIDAALRFVVNLKASTQLNIYFCISQQKSKSGHRDRLNATGLLVVPMDIDVKPDSPDHYHTLAEAVASLFWFCAQSDIPRPSFMVASGGGLHAYWLSHVVLLVDQWQPYADAIKNAARRAELKFDAGCTGDAARVLRVPDTTNWKQEKPRPVRLLQKYCPGTRFDFAEVFKPILGLPAPTKSVQAAIPDNLEVAPKFRHLGTKPLDEGIEGHDIPPLPFAPIKAACGFLREAHDTGGSNFKEPQWNLTTLIATFLENGNTLAHEFGNQHPGYSHDSTELKWQQKLQQRKLKNIGWPKCQTIAMEGSTHCKGCKHFPKGGSPLNIGHDAFKEAKIEDDLGQLGGKRPEDLRLPEGFCVDDLGRLCYLMLPKRSKNSILPARIVLVLLTVISGPSLQFQNGKFGVGFFAQTDRVSTTEVFMHSGQSTIKGGLLTHLHDKCVLINQEDGVDKIVQKFAVSWLDKLLKADIAIRDPGTMGWRYQDTKRAGFVYGNMLYLEDGSERPIMASTDDDFRSWYMPTGSREAWLAACKLLTDRKRPELDIIIAIAFAAPLMTFAGTLYGAIISEWGPPGTSKSTAQQVAAAVWGHPKQTRESLNSTPKSVQGRLGRCRNLPAYWDDIQDERHQDALFQTMFVATQGAEGGRLNTDASMKARLEWQTLLVACSNASFVEYLIRKQKSTTAGIRRVFEIEFNKQEGGEPGMVNATDAGRVFAELERNYGVIGAEYARILATEHKEIDLLVAELTKDFCDTVQGIGDENYWWGSCGVLLAGATLANRLGANLDIAAMDAFLHKAFDYNRAIRSVEGTEGGTYTNTERGLTGFLNFYVGSGNAIYLDRLFESRHKPVHPIRGPEKGHRIIVQVVRDQRKIIFSKREMRDYFAKHEIESRQIFDGLKKYFEAKENRYTLGAGTSFAQTQELCFEIFVPPDQPHILLRLLESQGVPQV